MEEANDAPTLLFILVIYLLRSAGRDFDKRPYYFLWAGASSSKTRDLPSYYPSSPAKNSYRCGFAL